MDNRINENVPPQDLEELHYGKILYENPDHFYKRDKKKHVSIMTMMALIGVFIITLPFYFNTYIHPFICFFIVLFGITLVIYSVLVFFSHSDRFKIFEKGIRFTNEKIPFLYFNEIDHVVLLRTINRYQEPLMLIKKKSGKEYRIANERTFGVDESVTIYSIASKIIIDKLMKVNKGADKSQLIRDIDKVKWSEEAEIEIKKHFIDVHFHFASRRIPREVIKKGRYVVELSDVLEFRKGY